jgi:hypothetical protein
MKKLHILIVYNNRLPVSKYGGTQRVIWSLGKELAGIGYQVTFLAGEGTRCNFAGVKVLDGSIPLAGQIPEEVDLVHSFINSLGGAPQTPHGYHRRQFQAR